MRNHEELTAINLAPTAHVAVPQLSEVDGPFILVFPFHVADFSLARINLHQRTGANNRKKSEILETYVAIHELAEVEMLQQTDQNFIPLLHHSCQKIRLLEAKPRFE